MESNLQPKQQGNPEVSSLDSHGIKPKDVQEEIYPGLHSTQCVH